MRTLPLALAACAPDLPEYHPGTPDDLSYGRGAVAAVELDACGQDGDGSASAIEVESAVGGDTVLALATVGADCVETPFGEVAPGETLTVALPVRHVLRVADDAGTFTAWQLLNTDGGVVVVVR